MCQLAASAWERQHRSHFGKIGIIGAPEDLQMCGLIGSKLVVCGSSVADAFFHMPQASMQIRGGRTNSVASMDTIVLRLLPLIMVKAL